jgi:hypothetical protein
MERATNVSIPSTIPSTIDKPGPIVIRDPVRVDGKVHLSRCRINKPKFPNKKSFRIIFVKSGIVDKSVLVKNLRAQNQLKHLREQTFLI